MKSIFSVLVLLSASALLSTAAQAAVFGNLSITQDNSKAAFILFENSEDGTLSRFYENLRLEEKADVNLLTKAFALPNGRFVFRCRKTVFVSAAPTTRCEFIITAGANDADLSTAIYQAGVQNFAGFGVPSSQASALTEIFPADAKGAIRFRLKTRNGLEMEIKGGKKENFTLSFWSRDYVPGTVRTLESSAF